MQLLTTSHDLHSQAVTGEMLEIQTSGCEGEWNCTPIRPWSCDVQPVTSAYLVGLYDILHGKCAIRQVCNGFLLSHYHFSYTHHVTMI